jgi:hypothetical protein
VKAKNGNAEGPGHVTLTHATDGSMAELVVRGRWSRKTAVDVYRAVQKGLAEHPAAIIVDLHQMSDLDGASASTWIALSQAAAMLHPPAQVALCAPPTRQVVKRLRQIGCTRFLSLFVTVDQARAAVAGASILTDRIQHAGLPPDPGTLTVVGEMVDQACRSWTVPEPAAATAREVALDLVGDSIRHAGTAMVFTVSRRSSSIYLALRDHGSTLPPLRRPPAGDDGMPEAGRLPVVVARSYVWGAQPTHDGKVVWAVIR